MNLRDTAKSHLFAIDSVNQLHTISISEEFLSNRTIGTQCSIALTRTPAGEALNPANIGNFPLCVVDYPPPRQLLRYECTKILVSVVAVAEN